MKELQSFAILQTLPEEEYDNITAIAAGICRTPISLVSLVYGDRQFFKSSHGLIVNETPREYSFCAHAIHNQEVFIVQDARKDEKFFDNPLVTDDPHVIFYAGVPLISNGYPIGTICVIDNKPKLLSKSQIKSLVALSKQVMNILKLRRSEIKLEKALRKLDEKNRELESFAFIAAHDLRSPLIGLSGVAKIVAEQYSLNLDDEGKQMLQLIVNSTDKLRSLVDGLLEYSTSESFLTEKKSNFDMLTLRNNIDGLFSYDNNLDLKLKTNISQMYANNTAVDQILINLVANAIKYNDKDGVEIEIDITECEKFYQFSVSDNGPGIAIDDQEKIFKIFQVATEQDRFGKKGNGIGLATVKKIVEKSGGSIKLDSELGKGAKFTFTLEK